MIPTSVRIFVCTERQDMRRSFDALALAVREVLALDPESGALFELPEPAGSDRPLVSINARTLATILRGVAK